MAATTQCLKPVRGRRMRVTRLDACGRPVTGAGNQVTTSGFVTVKMSMNVETGDEITVKNASGELCISDKACDQIKWIDVEFDFCEVDPDLYTMMDPTWTTELDADGNAVGFRMASNLSCDTGYAVELWSDLLGTDVCDNPDAQGAWGYFLLPWTVGGAPGDIEVTNDAVSFTLNGRTKTNARWGVGPYDVVMDADGAPAPLAVAIGPDVPLLFRATTVPPPDAVCGAGDVPGGGATVPLPAPTGLAVSGTPTATDFDVTWTAVAGATGYTATAQPAGPTAVVTGTDAAFTGATTGTDYTVSVVALGDGTTTSDSPAATTQVTTA